MERRKFLQLIGVGIVATAARLTTGGGGGNEKQPALPEPAPVKDGGFLVPDKFSKYLKEAHEASVLTRENVIESQRVLKMNGVPATIKFTQTPEDPDSWVDLSDTYQYTWSRSLHSNWDDDQELWKFKRRQTNWQGPVPPGFVILEPSEQMVEELKDLKATEISILARYTDD